MAGLASQQLANDPGGDRYIRLIDDAVTMFADHVLRPGAATARQDLTRLSAGSRRASTAARPAPLRSRPASRAGRARSYFLGRYRSRSRARSVFPLRSLTIATFLARSRSARPISPLAMRNSASSR